MVMTHGPWALPETYRRICRLAANCHLQYVGQRSQSSCSHVTYMLANFGQVTSALWTAVFPLPPGRRWDSMTFKGTSASNVKSLCWTQGLYNLVPPQGFLFLLHALLRLVHNRKRVSAAHWGSKKWWAQPTHREYSPVWRLPSKPISRHICTAPKTKGNQSENTQSLWVVFPWDVQNCWQYKLTSSVHTLSRWKTQELL